MATKTKRRRGVNGSVRPRVLNVGNESPDSDSEDDSPSQPAPGVWPRFLLLKANHETKKATQLHPFLVGRVLKSITGKSEAKRLKTGDLVQVSQKAHSLPLLMGLQPVHIRQLPSAGHLLFGAT
ncbi:hypothetical protein BaRGS_00024147 [Batillaria attramentaria]|uniref:Uncharacterized protein n=1 Tax=Batillaria attramentaria TaxID=370345 RepID=A0ABD0KC17_9CAEN